MGHIVNSEKEYRLLQQRLDYNITGAPYSPVFIEILKLLFSVEEADIARQIPLRPTPLKNLARKLNMPVEKLHDKISVMAEKGLVFDVEHKEECYVVLAPVVIGFFEFVFMRTRDEMPLKELAHLFEQYMFQDDRFAHSIFSETTQLGRSLVREEALTSGDYTEILDWEKASSVIHSAKTIGLSLCACRHKASHLGKSCNAPQKTCMTFHGSAQMLIKKGMAEEISSKEAMAVLEQCKEAGLAQIADNVQNHVGFICNCCGCCCGMLHSMKHFTMGYAVVTSNWLAQIDGEKCRGCNACRKACPLGAIVPEEQNQNNSTGRRVFCDEELCLGCGVCAAACKFDSIRMKPREKRVLVPENTFDRMISMAIERGKLSNFIFDDPSRLSHRALGRIAAMIEKSSPVKAFLAIEPIKSVFLKSIIAGAKKFV
ncbi:MULTISPECIES: 4Fe-4S dicluster domain-containing protein [Pelosinus]|uniref:4Fe-4S ferredoxin iron-sulfur binding domain-containing protein n=1 Tax=Pelosinus fermentans B4 TaxID=1149862 RepID=I9LFC4_9FIRM|nr:MULTISPECIES: 4Fe-4S dicluster domain-containing protein [Pelosinus]EIW19189.1 4Fe-4S ferredoxin iron-sulfur binding domain-containing protein [Pelosinus fermentans B4]EIW25079.1 4Fe-4S ferredoxin iron-sulfur binding domain-containing protein [Pelosinus fermentans A11]OAM96170.1 4Fe-4S ferredoxin iron-sulfur binding domain-containing protein [Pelosinus fermentans DSM 17108]SDR37121.1 4Fe-4S dicluster domain-containing protein [Pelosinus fermentans]